MEFLLEGRGEAIMRIPIDQAVFYGDGIGRFFMAQLIL
jgi:hypothetical protein